MSAPMADTAAARAPRRAAAMRRALGVAVAALLTANGVILAENTYKWDLEEFVKDGWDDARGALARALDPDGEATQAVAGGPGGDSTTTTTTPAAVTPGVAEVPTTVPDPAATPPTGATPAVPSTSRPGPKTGAKPGPATPGGPAVASPGQPGTAAPALATPAGTAPQPVFAALRTFVEAERGLTFKADPTVTRLADGPFKSRLAAYRLDTKTESARKAQGALRALGVIEPGVDLVAQINRLLLNSAPAFYDAAANELVVRGDPETPFARKILVHELTHALNDQHFELHRPELRANDDESAQAFEALYEGIAGDIEDEYVAQLPEGERKAIEAEQRRLAEAFPKDLPPYVLVSFGFPYTAGKRLAANLYDAGGAGRLNEALQRPPTTSEQVLRPEKYGAGEAAVALAAPGADGPVVTQGVFGQLTLALMLAGAVEGSAAEAAADGWGADRYVAWQNGGQTCARLAIVMDSAEHSGELGQALSQWAARRTGAVVEGSGPFTVTRCV